jgi:hypothetical protein
MAGMLLVAILSGGWVALSFVAAVMASAAGLPISGVFAFALLVGARIFTRAASAKAPRSPLALAFGALSLAPFVLCGAADRFTRPLVSSHFRCGTGDAMAIMMAPFGLFAWAVVAVLVGFVVMGRSERRALDLATRLLAGVAVVLGSVLLVLATLRSVGRIEPDRWFATASAKSPSIDLTTLPWQPATEDAQKAEVFGRTIFRTCSSGDYCSVSFDAANPKGLESMGIGTPRDHATLTHVGNVYVFSIRGYPDGAWDEQGHRTDISPSMVRSELAVPRAWLAFGWLAAATALGFLLFSRSRKVDLEGLRDGVVDATGSILLDDGTLWPQPRDTEWEEGQRVIAKPPREIESFRTDATPTFTLGTLEDLRGTERVRTTTAAAFALATIALGVAPVVAALLCLR